MNTGIDDASVRKARHLQICLDEKSYSVEGGGAWFDRVRFIHRALPELDARSIDTSLSFLGHDISLPLLISCMTGGSEQGDLINRRLAEAAQAARIPVGTGSIRGIFRDESLFVRFHVKPLAPDVPVIANLGAVQVRDLGCPAVVEMTKRLEAQGLAVHLNAGQELFQPGGDRDFRGLKEAIAKLCEASPVPIIVKETGFGIAPAEIDFLLGAGAAYVDLAGSGGTNWVLVESYRVSEEEAGIAREFADWGIPTAVLLTALGGKKTGRDGLRDRANGPEGSRKGRIIASGGLRSGVDIAKAVALGAALAGLALPFVRAVSKEGTEGALRLISGIDRSLRAAMVMTGSTDLRALRRSPLLRDPDLVDASERLLQC